MVANGTAEDGFLSFKKIPTTSLDNMISFGSMYSHNSVVRKDCVFKKVESKLFVGKNSPSTLEKVCQHKPLTPNV